MRLSFISVLSASVLLPLPALAQEVPDAIIVTAPGGDADMDDAIGLDARSIARGGMPNLLGAMTREVPGVSLAEAQANPYQPNLNYRGFTVSPLQGVAQGMAVYVDGARFNMPFGDTVNFDLLPDVAINGLSVRDASPVYGLNALGGSLVVATKTGRSAPGVSISVAGGDHDREEASVEAGLTRGEFSLYVAGEARDDGGWRRYSPSTLYNGLVDLGWDGASAGVHAKLIAADTDLTGNGAAPVELLAAARNAVFTHPDITRNTLWRGSLHPWIALGDAQRIEASLHYQSFRQTTLNGDLADIAPCADDTSLLCLGTAAGDEATLTDTLGASIGDVLGGGDYGLLNRSRTRSRSGGALVQYVDARDLFGLENELTLGFSHDRSRTRFGSSSELGALEEDRSVDGLGAIIAQADGSVAPVGLDVSTRHTGVFLADRLDLTPRLSAELGLRWNHARIDLSDRIGTALNGQHRFRRLNPGVEFDYALTGAVSLRTGYAETSRAPTPAELSCADEAAPCSLTNFFVGDPPLAQVVARSWEAGASGALSGAWRGSWLVSLYRATNSNDIVFTSASTRGRAFFRNVGETRRQGVEARISLVRGPWDVRLGYAFTDAHYLTPFTTNSPANPSADAEGRIAIARGDRLPGIARHRGVVSVDYAGAGFSLGVDAQAQTGVVFAGDDGNDEAPTRGFVRFDARGSVDLWRGARLFAHVTNVFNRRYATFGTFSETDEIDLAEAPGASDPRAVSPGAPRRVLLGFSLSY